MRRHPAAQRQPLPGWAQLLRWQGRETKRCDVHGPYLRLARALGACMRANLCVHMCLRVNVSVCVRVQIHAGTNEHLCVQHRCTCLTGFGVFVCHYLLIECTHNEHINGLFAQLFP